MLECWVVKMWCLLAVCPVLLVAGVQTLSIHTEWGTSVEDCFERISIGEQLPTSAIYRNVSELTTKECEQICKQDKQCQAYDYGVGAKGNATCDLSNLGEKDLKEKDALNRHPDYDVYIRRFQCEQSPPSPLKPLQDEGEGPTHRPIIRPEVDEPKRPLADEYLDSRPFETTRPDRPLYRPYPPQPPYLNHIDRPDDYHNQPPVYDRPPSYGLHRPQDIPYRPFQNQSDPYDILQFQGDRPQYPGNFRPDYPSRPSDGISDSYGPTKPRPDLPPYRPEEPEYVYITRPNRKPLRPNDDNIGYGNKPSRPDYNKPYDNRPPFIPSRPMEYPYRPYDRPNYDYNSQYASHYGQNQYNDNSIYVEIYDPPRPYKPSKPDRPYGSNYGQDYGYDGGSHASQNSFAQNSQSYGGSITQIDSNNRPLDSYLPSKPSSGYGSQDLRPEAPYNKPAPVYGPPKPLDFKPQKPSYSSASSSYGSSQGSQLDSYGSQGYQKPQDGYQTPPYNDKPSYDNSNSGYGNNRPVNDNQKPAYDSNRPGYDSNKPAYDSNKPNYDGNKPAYDNYRPSYDSNRPSYGGSQGSYGGSHGSYSSGQSSYGNSHGDQGYAVQPQGYLPPQSSYSQFNHQSSYGGTSNSYGSYQDSYRPSHDQKPYGYRPNHDRPQYDDQNSYGNKPNDQSYNRPLYDKPSYKPPLDDKPSYDRPSYDRPSYDRPSYDSNRPDGPSYDSSRPENKPGYDKPSSANYDKPDDTYNRPNRPDRPYQPEFDNNRPDGSYGQEDSEGYKSNKPKPNQTDGYNANKPDVKPVYEFEVDKPNNVPSYIVRPSGEVITSRPVTIGDYGRPGYGREPPVSYKACFRRVLAGKRALRSFVRRVAPCERLEDCRRECAEERRFHCESFNYRLDPSFRGKGLCEMMTQPIEAFDLRRDFVEDKDYDFYELDRNSLEPYCPETLRGPGLLHSGFLSSKPDKQSYQNSWDRNDFDRGQDRNYNRFYDRTPGPGYGGGRRRYENELYVPYQIGLARSNDDQENWGQYGGHYGNSYYKDRNDYHKSISHWGLNDLEPPAYGVRPHANRNFNYYDLGKKIDRYNYGSWKRGRWNSSGPTSNGLDYADSSYYKPHKPVFYESSEESLERSDEVVLKDCTARRKPGMSLGSGAVRRSLTARNVVQCEAACFNEREFKCVSYSYRYSTSRGVDNCFLSERPYRGLQLAADSGSDVYAMPERAGCAPPTNDLSVESECFWHVRSGAAVGGAAARAAITVAGLGACEAECIRSDTFFCRGFSFRFDSPTIGDDLENCVLTSSPPTSLETGRGLRSNSGHELYARGNYGRGCEPALYDDVHVGETGECYLQYDNAAKLIGSAVKGQARVRDERACGQACTDAPFRCLSFSYNNNAPPGTDNCLLSEIRLFDLQRDVDYSHSADDWLFAFDLFNSQCWRKATADHDREAPELPRPLSPPPETYSGPSAPPGPSGPTGYLPAPPAPPAEPHYVPSGPPSGPTYKPSYPGPGYLPAAPGPDFSEPSGPYRPSGPSGPRPSGPGYLPTGATGPGYGPSGPYRPSGPPSGPPRPPGPPSGPLRPSGPPSGPLRPSGPPPRPGYPGYIDGGRPEYPGPPSYPDIGRPYPGVERPGYGPPSGPPGPPGPGLRPGHREEEGIVVSWRHYTVSGFPCRKGSSCAQNTVAGHWSCEPEGGEIGSWDYCCAPTHKCGYSEGFHKPWCYVGPSKDQWRPCSEKYYPYHQHNIPHPSQGNRDGPGPLASRPDLPYLPEADRRYWDQLYNNGPQAYYDRYGNPLPGYTRVPTEDRPYIKYHHNSPRPASGHWVPVSAMQELDPPVPGGLGVPRYWPVAYLHKSPPPNTTYFKYNHSDHSAFDLTSSTERYEHRPPPSRDLHKDPDFRDSSFHRDPNVRGEVPREHNKEPDSGDNRPRGPILREPYPRESNTRDPYSREPNYRDPYPREPNPRDPYPREPNLRDTYPREPNPKKENPRDPYPREQNPREPIPRDPVPREQEKERPRDRTMGRERPITYAKVNPDRPANNNLDIKNLREEKTRNVTEANDDILNSNEDKTTTTNKPEVVVIETVVNNNKTNLTETESVTTQPKDEENDKVDKELENLKGIDDKIDDFSHSIEVLDIEDAKKGEKLADLKMLEAEERQIEAIGRLLAARRGGKLILEKRSQKDLETKSIALDKDLVDFNFGNKFPTGTERRGTVQRVTKGEIERERNIDKSLEVSETTYVRPPRVLSTTENIRKAIVNGKIFYSASVRDQRDLTSTSTRRPKSLNLRPLEERAPSVIANNNYGKKKVVRTRNVPNPVRKVRRVYRRKYNPEEVRKRLLEREKSMKDGERKL